MRRYWASSDSGYVRSFIDCSLGVHAFLWHNIAQLRICGWLFQRVCRISGEVADEVKMSAV